MSTARYPAEPLHIPFADQSIAVMAVTSPTAWHPAAKATNECSKGGRRKRQRRAPALRRPVPHRHFRRPERGRQAHIAKGEPCPRRQQGRSDQTLRIRIQSRRHSKIGVVSPPSGQFSHLTNSGGRCTCRRRHAAGTFPSIRPRLEFSSVLDPVLDGGRLLLPLYISAALHSCTCRNSALSSAIRRAIGVGAGFRKAAPAPSPSTISGAVAGGK